MRAPATAVLLALSFAMVTAAAVPPRAAAKPQLMPQPMNDPTQPVQNPPPQRDNMGNPVSNKCYIQFQPQPAGCFLPVFAPMGTYCGCIDPATGQQYGGQVWH